LSRIRAKPWRLIPQPFKFNVLGLCAAIGRRAGVTEILGMKFPAWLWRGI
jgi:hypothetical protein